MKPFDRAVELVGVFSPEECGRLLQDALEQWETEPGEVNSGSGGYGLDQDYRSVTLYKADENELILNPVIQRIWRVSREYNGCKAGWGFDLSSHRIIETVCVMKYEKGGHYDWHMDLGSEGIAMKRKLAFSLLLNHGEYDGGRLEVMTSRVTEAMGTGVGNLVLFPSYIMHRVTEVTLGVRYALVGWIHGFVFQ